MAVLWDARVSSRLTQFAPCAHSVGFGMTSNRRNTKHAGNVGLLWNSSDRNRRGALQTSHISPRRFWVKWPPTQKPTNGKRMPKLYLHSCPRPVSTQVGKASQRVTRLQREFQQAVEAWQNAERLSTNTKEKAVRIAGRFEDGRAGTQCFLCEGSGTHR